MALGPIAILPSERISPLVAQAPDGASAEMLSEFDEATSYGLAHAAATMPGEAEESASEPPQPTNVARATATTVPIDARRWPLSTPTKYPQLQPI